MALPVPVVIAGIRLSPPFGRCGARLRADNPIVPETDPGQAAASAGLSYETARWYLKSIFQKTGTRRQAELIRTLVSEQVAVQNRLLQ